MKCVLLTLFVAAAAQQIDGGHGDSSQGDGGSSQGVQSVPQESDNSYGYEAPAEVPAEAAPVIESYAAPTESYEPAVAVAIAAKCCVSVCPDEAPFFNPATCSCVPGMFDQDVPQYGVQSYGAPDQQQGYRKLQSYGAPVQSYGEEAAPAFTSGPEGTVDTRGLRITRSGTIVLWVGFGILFILACYYLRMFHWYYSVASSDEDVGEFDFKHDSGSVYTANAADRKIDHSILHFLANPSLIAGCVCLIASLAYLTMATNNGWYARCHDGRQFFFARYIDWIITTPLMLHALTHFGNAPDEIWTFLFFSDVLMIASGLVASTIDGGEKWIYYGFSILAFIPVLYYICKLRDQTLNNRLYNAATGFLWKHSGSNDNKWGEGHNVDMVKNSHWLPYIWFFHNYQVIGDLTVLAWCLYPIVWIFAEGTNKMSVTAEAITYTVLDLISKGVFGWFIVHATWENPHDKFHSRYVVKKGDSTTPFVGPLN